MLDDQDCECEPGLSVNGELQYISPEKVQGDYFSYSSDIWSLGVVFYELMGLELPFETEKSTYICNKIKKADFHPSQETIQMN
jgi:serine/threonine protein kinase